MCEGMGQGRLCTHVYGICLPTGRKRGDFQSIVCRSTAVRGEKRGTGGETASMRRARFRRAKTEKTAGSTKAERTKKRAERTTTANESGRDRWTWAGHGMDQGWTAVETDATRVAIGQHRSLSSTRSASNNGRNGSEARNARGGTGTAPSQCGGNDSPWRPCTFFLIFPGSAKQVA